MVTFKAIIISNNRRADGTYQVKIRVTYKGVSRRLPTTMVCTPYQLTRSLKIKDADILRRADSLIAKMQRTLEDVPLYFMEGWDVDKVVGHIRTEMTKGTFRLDFFEFGEQCLRNVKASTAATYRTALNNLKRFLGRDTLDINEINRALLTEFVQWIETTPKYNRGLTTCAKRPNRYSVTLSKLSFLHKRAKDAYNDEDNGVILIPLSPFEKIERKRCTSQGQRSLGKETMQRIISARTKDTVMQLCLDSFVVSFALMGANMADLYGARLQAGTTWVYNRKKTRDRRDDGAEMRVEVPKEIAPRLARLQGRSTEALHLVRRTDANLTSSFVNKHLKKWAKDEGLPEFTFYAARHTWATVARSAGVEKATIDECLAHIGDYKVTDIYAERDWDIINAANRKVLDLFSWE